MALPRDGVGRPDLRKLTLGTWRRYCLLLIAVNHSGRLIDVVYAKGVFRDPAWVEFARWNAISRVEVDRQGKAKAIVIDADASTYIMNVDPKHWQGTEWQKNLMSAPPALANVLRPHGDYAIIGPGGGVDVLRAVANGSPSVTGIEINPIIANTIMRGRYADYSYHLYQRPEVHIHVTDGRSFVRNARQQFRRGADDSGGHLGLHRRRRVRPERKQPVYRGGFPRIFRTSETRRHDRHHPLGVPASRAKPCAWYRSPCRRCTTWEWRIRPGIHRGLPRAIWTKTEFRWSCWPRKAPSLPRKSRQCERHLDSNPASWSRSICPSA